MNWQVLLYIVGAGLLAWLAYRSVKSNPEAFSKSNISKSITTCGILALLLIGLIALCVWGLRSG
ncbi:MAG: hypothetical protein K0U29_00020 [Gammaproteobacteria bacterium]|nr:hypothetical protein [Gammaproteobacteria bacterium]MCH9743292.1 hypothetical protein [Gammaproteobacteria bacterium]